MLKIDKEEEDNDSDRPIPPQTPNKSVTNTPIKENATLTATTTITGDSTLTTPHSVGGHPITNFGINHASVAYALDDARNVNNIQMNTPVLPRKVSECELI